MILETLKFTYNFSGYSLSLFYTKRLYSILHLKLISNWSVIGLTAIMRPNKWKTLVTHKNMDETPTMYLAFCLGPQEDKIGFSVIWFFLAKSHTWRQELQVVMKLGVPASAISSASFDSAVLLTAQAMVLSHTGCDLTVPWDSVQLSSVAQSCLTLCNPMDCSTPNLPVRHQLLEFTQTHVHWVSDAIQPSHPVSSPSPPTFNLSQHQGLFKWVSSSQQVVKVLEFQLQHQYFQSIFRTDFL